LLTFALSRKCKSASGRVQLHSNECDELFRRDSLHYSFRSFAVSGECKSAKRKHFELIRSSSKFLRSSSGYSPEPRLPVSHMTRGQAHCIDTAPCEPTLVTVSSEAAPVLKQTPLHAEHVRLGARMVDF